MPRNNFKAYIALACVCFFWGTTFIASRAAVETMPVAFVSGIRCILAGILLGSYVFGMKRYPIPSFKDIKIISINGFLMIGLANALLVWALRYMPTNTASIICASLPFWVLGLNMIFQKSEKINSQIFIGLTVGFSGLLLIFYDGLFVSTTEEFGFGLMLAVLCNISWAAGMVLNKKHKTTANPFVVATIQLIFTGIVMNIFGLFTVDNYDFLSFSNTKAWLAILYLVTFGSITGYGAYIYSLAHLPVTVVSLYTYINPLVAIFLGWWLLDEKINAYTWLSIGLILISVYVVNKGFQNKKEVSKEEKTETEVLETV
ncbi:MAG: EamA family transporter [Thermoflexibacter sp.]|jgi:drug/metabolite transporter (DMT)-like permease|nr:EamA family transporter [Thermoflexibacter sp.]